MARLVHIALAVAVAISLFGCGGGAPGDEPWPKTAGDTTCSDWLDSMTVAQRRGLAEAMLTSLWESDGAASTPDDAKVLKFANAVGGTCASYRDEKVSTVGGGLYVLSDDIKP